MTAPGIELALRRRASARLRVLARWAGPRVTALAPLFDDEDRRSLRALVRGTIAGVGADARVTGLIATPMLPMRALGQLASVSDLPALAALLAIWRHPFASAVLQEAQRTQPDPFRIETALTRAYAARAEASARQADAPMRRHVALVIDLENLWTALALTESTTDVAPAHLFVAGGALVTGDDLAMAAETRAPLTVLAAVRRRAAGSPLLPVLEAAPRAIEDRALDTLVALARREALREPLSTAPIIAFAMRQRAELRTLLRITWGIALGASRRHLEAAIGVAA